MKILAKFKCESVTKYETQENIVMKPIMKDSDNKDWSKFTPNGKIEMSITNEGAVGQFVPGKVFLVTFTESE